MVHQYTISKHSAKDRPAGMRARVCSAGSLQTICGCNKFMNLGLRLTPRVLTHLSASGHWLSSSLVTSLSLMMRLTSAITSGKGLTVVHFSVQHTDCLRDTLGGLRNGRVITRQKQDAKQLTGQDGLGLS